MFLSKTISLLYKGVLKPVFFRFDPEFVHDRIISVGGIIGKSDFLKRLVRNVSYKDKSLEQNLFGLDFKNPVGLAAGFDKDGRIFDAMESVGFGFAEIGTVTLKPYHGNPHPRLFRLPKSKGLVVYYGLKNDGANEVIKRLVNKKINIPQIISIGRTNSEETSNFEEGTADFVKGVELFSVSCVGDAYEMNISCPNTYGGEPFTDPDKLEAFFLRLSELKIEKPIFIKMPINLPWHDFKKLIDISIKHNASAITIGNLNKSRLRVVDRIPHGVKGNVSGKPTEDLSNDLIRKTYRYAGDKIKIIGVGGIFSAEDAYKKIRLGASLVELITGMIFEGPQLIGDINRKLVLFLKRDGFKNISEAVGKDA